jgi:hypothetical protein
LKTDEKINLNKRFSIPHFDNWSYPSLYYEAIKNSSQQFKDEIYDIYFGKKFRYKYREQEIYDNYAKLHEVVYGNVMGVEASDEQLDNLFKIQEEFGIEISLTINQLNIPVEIFFSKNNRVLDAFLNWLQEFYDRGLRSCTLANNHLMRAGFLQKRFPEMKWKNTVNQQVYTSQQVLDYLYLGYNMIQLDRSLNRNMDELKRIKAVVENYKNKYPEKHVKTCMLVWEDCLPSCPFKREHDDIQIYFRRIKYWDSYLGALTCRRWRDSLGKSIIPRSGTNCFWASVDTFQEYAELVDIFKYSGRLVDFVPLQGPGNIQFGWLLKNYPVRLPRSYAIKSFSEIIENRLESVHLWFPIPAFSAYFKTDTKEIKEDLKDGFFTTDEAKKLEQTLKNCKNQCYKCHLCERTFGIPDIDSMIEL